jgi:hypothetical protein
MLRGSEACWSFLRKYSLCWACLTKGGRVEEYEYLVMPFDLVNAPGIFKAMVNAVLRELLNHSAHVYF